MSILALSPNRVSRAVQMASLITSCAAKCSMGSQSCQWKGSILLSVTIRRIQPNVCPAKDSSSCLPLCEKSVSTFYCPSLSQTSTVGKVSSVKLFHKLSKNTASRKPTKTSSLQARNYQTTSAVSKTLPGFQTPNKTAKAQARSKVPLPSSTSG